MLFDEVAELGAFEGIDVAHLDAVGFSKSPSRRRRWWETIQGHEHIHSGLLRSVDFYGAGPAAAAVAKVVAFLPAKREDIPLR